MNCTDMETQAVCLRSSDGSKTSAVAHYEYGLDASAAVLNTSTRFTDASGIVVYDIADYEDVTVGSCPLDIQCVESQEWTYGIDNTGTNYRWPSATYEMVLSDGSTFQWTQTTAANGGWTPQMEEWGQEIQAAADAAGIKWFVETRYRQPSDPSNLAGGGGFAGPPSLAVSNALTSMLWRYVNIQICPGQPVPVAANLIAVGDAGGAAVPSLPYSLTTDGAVLGPIQKFGLCTECGQAPVWYLEDGVTLAEAGQIPNCWEPCGTLALTDAPPDRACEFFFASACDNQNDPDPLSWIQDITRRTTVCNGEVLSVDYLQADPGDPTALVAYDLLGAFVDCASGEAVDDEIPECADYEHVGNLWKFIPQGEIGTLIEWWKDVADGGNSAAHDAPASIFSLVNNSYEHPNGPAFASYVAPTFSTSTSSAAFIAGMGQASNADTNGTDQLKLSGYVNLPRAGVVSDTNTNTGERGLFAIQYCCVGEMVTVSERTTDSVSGDAGIFTNVELPAGIHYVEIMTSDLSAWQGMEFSLSLDDGITTVPFISSTAKPYYECIPVLKCLDSGILVHAETGEVVEVEFNDSWCEPKCVSPEPIAVDPTAAQDDFVALGKLYKLNPPVGDGFLRSREWRDTEPASPLTTADSTVLGGEMRERHDFSLVPDSDLQNYATLALNDIDNTPAILTVQVVEGYLTLDEAKDFRYTATSEGYTAVEAKVCCGDLELLTEGGGFPHDPLYFSLPAGVHYVRLWGIDVAGSNHGATLGYSTDGGVTYTNDNTPPGVTFSLGKPTEDAVIATQNKWTLVISDALTGDVLDPTEWSACSQLCEPTCCGATATTETSTGGTSPTAQEIADAMVTTERARTEGRMENWQNNTDTQSLAVPAGTIGCLRSITDYGTGAVYWTIDGTTPTAANGSTMSVQYGNNIDLCGIDLSLVRMNGSSTGSDYSVTYEIWS